MMLTNLTFAQAMTEIDRLRDKQLTPPYSMSKAVSACGLKLLYVQDEWQFEQVKSALSLTAREDGDVIEIYIDETLPSKTRRFFIAFNIALYLCAAENLTERVLYTDNLFRSGLSRDLEFDCLRIASELLMPSDWVNWFIKNDCADTDCMADQFSVSLSAMATRLGVPAMEYENEGVLEKFEEKNSQVRKSFSVNQQGVLAA